MITAHLKDTEADIGRTKAQVLRTIKALPIGDKLVSAIRSEDIVCMARDLKSERTGGTVLAKVSPSILPVARSFQCGAPKPAKAGTKLIPTAFGADSFGIPFGLEV